MVDTAHTGQAIGTPTAEPSFPQDVRAAVRLWRGNITVPVIYLVIACAGAVLAFVTPRPEAHCVHRTLGNCPVHQSPYVGLAYLAVFPLLIFQLGLAGAARVWYVRRQRNEHVPFSEIWALSWRFFGRFLVLAIYVGLIALPFVVGAAVAAQTTNNHLPYLLMGITVAVLFDIALTFVTPWLALFQPRPGHALREGWRILRASWPRSLPYALVPPLAFQVLAQAFRSHVNHWVLAAFALVGPPLTLAFSGATVLFLLRRYPEPTWNGSLDTWPEPTGRHRISLT